jgi:hypothetical protein
MRQTKIIVAVILVLIVQIACVQEYSGEPVPTVVVQIPSVVKRGQESSFMVEAVAGSACYIGVGYYNLDSHWTTRVELPKAIANSEGKCEWKWTIPEDAKYGVGEIRGYIEIAEREDASIFPHSFCIEVCP